MFSGIIENIGRVVALKKKEGNLDITLSCPFVNELKTDQSISHNGVCLTVVSIKDQTYTVTAIDETLNRSNLGQLQVGDIVNLERSLKLGDRLDGHIVQGHVDQTAVCTNVKEVDGSWVYSFSYHFDAVLAKQGYTTVEKGSVSVNGVSLTVCNSGLDNFNVAIIPYTHEHTNFCNIKVGTIVNIEFDILGKYLSKLMNFR